MYVCMCTHTRTHVHICVNIFHNKSSINMLVGVAYFLEMFGWSSFAIILVGSCLLICASLVPVWVCALLDKRTSSQTQPLRKTKRD
jgi:hypothetical protein